MIRSIWNIIFRHFLKARNNKMFFVPMAFMFAATLTSLVITIINKAKELAEGTVEGAMWGHSFFAELDGDAESEEGKDLITQMKAICDRLIIAGNYKSVAL